MQKNLSLIALATALAASLPGCASVSPPPLELISQVPLPAVTGGDFDHFDADLTRQRLYVSAEEFGSIEIFSLPGGEHLASERTVSAKPHKIQLTDGGKQLLIADAGVARLNIVDTRTFSVTQSVPLKPQPDSGILDRRTGIFYLGNGGSKSHETQSVITMLRVSDGAVLGAIEVPAGQVKAMAIDEATDRLFVNFRDRHEIGVIGLNDHTLSAIWPIPGPSRNSAMEIDPDSHHLFVGARNPGVLLVLDTRDGHVIQTLPTVETSDEIILDKQHGRLYVAGSTGLDVFKKNDRSRYEPIQHIDTHGGKTAMYVPSLERLYVVHTKGPAAAEAGLQVFAVH